MKNQTLSIEQMKHLKDLGVDVSKASMCWINGDVVVHFERTIQQVFVNANVSFDNENEYVPTFTLQDICELFENVKYKSIGFPIMFFDYNYSFRHWELALRNPSGFENPIIKEKTPIDAAYKMLCWLAENGHLKGGKP